MKIENVTAIIAFQLASPIIYVLSACIDLEFNVVIAHVTSTEQRNAVYFYGKVFFLGWLRRFF